MSWSSWVDDQLASIREQGRWREPIDLDALGMEGTLQGHTRRVVSFASNDYLGMGTNLTVRRAAAEALDRWGTGSGSARLIVGSRPVHSELESELADWKNVQAAVLFPSGFAANLGVLSVFGAHGSATVLSDELNHASIIDGCRLSRAEVVIYRHRDVEHLNRLLREVSGPAIVVTESVFSMDGDEAPIDAIADLCAERSALLVVDEAHAVLGPKLPEVPELDLLRVGTLSKFLGSVGGFVAGPTSLCQLLVNRARPYIFTTAPSPVDSAAALAGLRVLRSPQGDKLLSRLSSHVRRLAPHHPSPIVPVVVGEELSAVCASRELLERGLLVPAIRPPTVPVGTSRLRITLSAAHLDTQVGHLLEALAELGLSAALHEPLPT